MVRGQKVVVECRKKFGKEYIPYKSFKGSIVQVCTSFIVISNGIYNESFELIQLQKGLIKIEVLKEDSEQREMGGE